MRLATNIDFTEYRAAGVAAAGSLHETRGSLHEAREGSLPDMLAVRGGSQMRLKVGSKKRGKTEYNSIGQ